MQVGSKGNPTPIFFLCGRFPLQIRIYPTHPNKHKQGLRANTAKQAAKDDATSWFGTLAFSRANRTPALGGGTPFLSSHVQVVLGLKFDDTLSARMPPFETEHFRFHGRIHMCHRKVLVKLTPESLANLRLSCKRPMASGSFALIDHNPPLWTRMGLGECPLKAGRIYAHFLW